ncbi:hypothetical protein [Streptomyces sp. NEAU-S7GS2]|uniref:hypothetical protein n=1 Tax=Streptomyces sp. NEAU-S7GS2 TaxID=2202000 RepID=UPI000D6F885C|nr:hypothetical protein [Streptomyces sp. NEAU-S7GS2]AWN24933.1 hypothetical protein DKG71_01000 [Streptomyces sp. NEAU-S7GS2]
MDLTVADRSLLAPINTLLRDQPDAEIIPLADRSYQFFGDEKRLDGIMRNHLVAKGLLDLTTHLRARPAPAPLAMYELGPAPWMLIVENTAAFTSLREILGTWPDRSQVGWLGFGAGDLLIASIPTALTSFCERDHPVDTLLMYGDLDLDGLQCAQQASQRAQDVGLPPLLPAAGLYQALLTGNPRAHPPATVDAARAAAAWLPSHLASPVAQLLTDGQVLRQEAFPRPQLRVLLTPDANLLSLLRDGTTRRTVAQPAPVALTPTRPAHGRKGIHG